MWIGQKTHKAIREFLEREKDEKEIKFSIQEEMENEFKKSESNDYSKQKDYKDFGLIEHYRGEDISGKDLLVCIQKVTDNFDAFLTSKYRKLITDAIKTNRKFEIDRQDFDNTNGIFKIIPGITVFVKPDVFFEMTKNKYCFLDWKTGNPNNSEDEISLQLKTYALDFTIFPELVHIEAYNIYLPSLKEQGGLLNNQHIKEAISTISADVRRMQQYLVDIENNIPLPEENFRMTQSENKCRVCTYRELCYPEEQRIKIDQPPRFFKTSAAEKDRKKEKREETEQKETLF
jgi:hypothetical protein